jgi:hypothetical protein
MDCQGTLRWIRIRVNALRLAFRIWKHNRSVRALKAKLEAYLAAHPGRDLSDAHLIEQVKLAEFKGEAIQAAERVLRIAARYK